MYSMMKDAKLRKRGRPKVSEGSFDRRKSFGTVCVTLDLGLIEILRRLRRDVGEPSLSGVVRRLLRERLAELGLLGEEAKRALGVS